MILIQMAANKKIKLSKWLQNPRSVILSEINQSTIVDPEQSCLHELKVAKKMSLPPMHRQSQCKRFKTEPDQIVSRRSQMLQPLNIKNSSIILSINAKLRNLSEMRIVEGGAIRNIRYAGHIRIPTVHNDYHSSKTNGGFSRNKFGGIFPK